MTCLVRIIGHQNWKIPLLEKSGQKPCQCLIGIEVWLVCIGHFDTNLSINQLSHFTQSQREGHLKYVLRIFGFLNKWQNKGVTTKANPLYIYE